MPLLSDNKMALISFATKETIIMSETRSFWLSMRKMLTLLPMKLMFTLPIKLMLTQQAQAAMIR